MKAVLRGSFAIVGSTIEPCPASPSRTGASTTACAARASQSAARPGSPTPATNAVDASASAAETVTPRWLEIYVLVVALGILAIAVAGFVG